jgi:hypothetical protein
MLTLPTLLLRLQDYEQAFGVAVCSQCRKYEPTISKVCGSTSASAARDQHGLKQQFAELQMTHCCICCPSCVQSNAKSTYLLNDADLAKLGFIEKQNPRHKELSAMKMLLVSQVGTAAAT